MDSNKIIVERPQTGKSETKSTTGTIVIKKKQVEGSQITVKQFFDFLKTAYQVNEGVEAILLANGLTNDVDWIKLKESQLVKPRSIACQTSQCSLKDDKKEVHKKRSDASAVLSESGESIKNKLGEVLSEGILDSVLNYMVPSNTSLTQPQLCRRNSQAKLSDKSSNCSINSQTNEKGASRRKSVDSSTSLSKQGCGKFDSEVVIHVCDEVKNAKKDFMCNQNLLIEKMGYFSEVTAGQRLEDMDISVHCDIGIFEWLMRWVKKDCPSDEDDEGPPELDPQCVISVLVSAAFLQMDPLLHECLLFCHRNMNDILKTSTNLSCLNDAVMTRLAAMYTNSEVEGVRDRKDKIQCRLYCKLIQSLCEPEPESMRGHWCSLARVYRCGQCKQLVSPSVSSEIPCLPSCMRLLCDGSVMYIHERDPAWNINDYVESLYKSLKSWRKVYWHLWGDAHFLYCTVCKRYFPAHQIAWCRFHPDQPQFFTVDAQRAPLPVGRFPCCGERAYRFQLLEGESGCQFREHIPSTETVRETAILSLLETFRQLIEENAPKLMFPERLTRLVAKAPTTGEDKNSCEGKIMGNHHFWWEGLELIPTRPKFGLINGFSNTNNKEVYEALPQIEIPIPEDDYFDSSDSSSSTDSSSSGRRSEENYLAQTQKYYSSPKNKAKKRQFRYWQHNLSARSNQDIQRAHEESTLKQISTILGRKTVFSIDSSMRISNKIWPKHRAPAGGLWVRLENEWREQNNLPLRVRGSSQGKQKLKSNRTS